MTSNQYSRHRSLGLVILHQRDGGFAHQVALEMRELWIPYIENQYRARHVRVVPRLVLDRIVEHPTGADLPLARLAADSKSAARGPDQRPMNRHACIGHPGVGRNPGVRL